MLWHPEEETVNQTADMGQKLLRHAVATIAYRGGKALRGAPESFRFVSNWRCDAGTGEVGGHVGDLFDWALSMAKGEHVWKDSEPLPWIGNWNRFFATLKAFDD